MSEAAILVPRVEYTEVRTAGQESEAMIAIFAVMITLPATKLIVTWDLSTPAAVAILCCKLEVSK